ncbi:Cytochrome P450 [Neofusicoccum parvum]|nr:Cytochrome P450 [Neofusicoccum parvum]
MDSNTTGGLQTHDAPRWLVSAVAALAFHAAIQPFELLDVLLWQISGVFGVSAIAIFCVDVQFLHSSPSHAAWNLAVSATSFATTLAASILIYRAFFHRLRKLPGPPVAKLTKFWSVYHSSKAFQYRLKLEELHKEYGDVVRTGPREVSIARVSALPQVASFRKTMLYQQTDWKQERIGMLATRDFEDHRRRRRPWEMAVTMKELTKYDAEMQRTIGLFLDQISCERGQRINITDRIAWLTYDLMGVIGFGKDFGNLRSAKESPAIKGLRTAMASMGILFPVPWLTNVLSHMPGLGDVYWGPFVQYCRQLVEEKQQAFQADKSEAPKDIISWLIRAFEEGSPNGAPTPEALHEDTRSLVIAGADTTYSALVNAFYYLALNPPIYAKLQADVDGLFPDGDASYSHDKAKDIPLLDGIINETLRLKPPIPNGAPRMTPPDGFRIDDDLYIPGNVDVWMPQWVIQRDERYFERPLEFIPERWIAGHEKAGMVKDRTAFFPFQIGTYYCVGKQLAMWEMRSVLARLALRYNIRFASAADGKDFDEKLLDTWTMAPPPLGMCFRARKSSKP